MCVRADYKRPVMECLHPRSLFLCHHRPPKVSIAQCMHYKKEVATRYAMRQHTTDRLQDDRLHGGWVATTVTHQWGLANLSGRWFCARVGGLDRAKMASFLLLYIPCRAERTVAWIGHCCPKKSLSKGVACAQKRAPLVLHPVTMSHAAPIAITRRGRRRLRMTLCDLHTW